MNISSSFGFAEGNLAIPYEYGQVIFGYNEKSPKQVYVIALSHRDSITRLNGSKTARVQAEVFKIGECLIQQRDIGLLLPEGFFVTRVEKVQKESFEPPVENRGDCIGLDINGLEQKLSDNRVFLNAEILLKRNYLLRLEQIEEKRYYDDVKEGLNRFIKAHSSDHSLLKSELDYLQERRTGAMLQKLPDIIHNEFRQGTIRGEKAIFTIGMSHIPYIIKYLTESRIAIDSPRPGSSASTRYEADLNLSKEHYGVTIIIPRTLMNDRQALEMNRLEKIAVQ